MEWYLKVMKQYADFNGRARRKEYWMFFLFNMIFALVAILVDNLLGLRFNEQIPYGYLYLLYGLATFIPGIAVGVRRLHDVGKSGWWYFIAIIPLAGLYLLYLFVQDGTPGSNEYGVNPKENYNEINEIGQKQF